MCVLIANFMNGHIKPEWTENVLRSFLTKENICESSRTMLMNFNPEFLITVIRLHNYIFNSSLVNFNSHVQKSFSFHSIVLLSSIRSCNKYDTFK